MDENVINKLYELVDCINSNEKILVLKHLKESIKSDVLLKEDLNKFHEIINSPYDENYVKLKSKILNNKNVKKYKMIENELFFVVSEISSKLKGLINQRKCSN